MQNSESTLKFSKKIVTRLKEFCNELNNGPQKIYLFHYKRTRNIYLLKDVLTNPRKFIRFLLNLKNGLPLILKLPLSCKEIYVRHNIHIIYQNSECNTGLFIAKIAGIDPDRTEKNFAAEIRARKLYSRLKKPLHIPGIYDYDKKSYSWITQKWITDSSMATANNKIKMFLERHALDMYYPFARSRSIGYFLKRHKTTYSEVNDFFSVAGAGEGIMNQELFMTTSLIHGDLYDGNLIYEAETDTLYVIDFEGLKVGSVAYDLVPLIKQETILSVCEVIKKCSADNDAEPLTQLRIAIALKIIDLRNNEALYRWYVSRYGIDLARNKIEKEKQQLHKIFTLLNDSESNIEGV